MRTHATTFLVTVVLYLSGFLQDRGHAAGIEPIACPPGDGIGAPDSFRLIACSEGVGGGLAGIDWRSPLRDVAAETILAYDLYASVGAAAAGISGSLMTDPDSGSSASDSSVSGGRDVADLPILAAPERDALPMACIGLVGAAWACRRQMKQRRDGAAEGEFTEAA